MNDPKVFDIELYGQTTRVTVHNIRSARVFRLISHNSRPPLNIIIAETTDGGKFWTSLPEGRQEEAELAGKVIASYIREYRRQQACAITTDKK